MPDKRKPQYPTSVFCLTYVNLKKERFSDDTVILSENEGLQNMLYKLAQTCDEKKKISNGIEGGAARKPSKSL